MMYQSKLVASLKANGKILREFKDIVYVPFGQEYSFLLKNLNNTRALVNIFIDGDNIVEGGLVINAGQEINLERYIKNGNLSEGNRFKFIERTAAIEDGPRGVKLEDGLIRIEFQFEKPYVGSVLRNSIFTQFGGPTTASYNATTYNAASYHDKRAGAVAATQGVNAVFASAASGSNNTVQGSAASYTNQDQPSMSATMDWNDIGITVPGSKSNQKFQTVTMGVMEAEKHTIVLRLLGETPDNRPIVAPVTVERKPECVTCGRKNRATSKFCVECGTHLTIYA